MNLSAAQKVSNLIKFDVGVLLVELIILICKYLAWQQHIVVLFTIENYLFSLNQFSFSLESHLLSIQMHTVQIKKTTQYSFAYMLTLVVGLCTL